MVKEEQNKSPKILVGSMFNQCEFDDLYKSMTYGKGKFDNYIVAYIDFLGFAEKMKEEHSYDSLNKLKFLLQKATTLASKISNINEIDDFDIKIFLITL